MCQGEMDLIFKALLYLSYLIKKKKIHCSTSCLDIASSWVFWSTHFKGRLLADWLQKFS